MCRMLTGLTFFFISGFWVQSTAQGPGIKAINLAVLTCKAAAGREPALLDDTVRYGSPCCRLVRAASPAHQSACLCIACPFHAL